ncbi:hypothetical protein K0651_13370 [Ornithinimicrobium sp. Arc0846-15]|nr:hypothetical protein [Ornithinimicrobium laminariae]
MSAVEVGELKRAWNAVQAGEFRCPTRVPAPEPEMAVKAASAGRPIQHESWQPTDTVIPVLGCHGWAGATTVAVALATVATAPARVVETCGVAASGLTACATAELGVSSEGWSRGTFESAGLEHATDLFAHPGEVPPPTPSDKYTLTILDVGWESSQLFCQDSWVTQTVLAAPQVVLVTSATVPGLRRLEGVLHLLSEHTDAVIAVVGPPRRRWPRHVRHSLGAKAKEADQSGHLVDVPQDATLATRGLDSSPLPSHVLASATKVFKALDLDLFTPTEGTP